MTAAQACKYGEKLLAASGAENARNESLWILESVTGMSASRILACGDEEIDDDGLAYFIARLEERANGRPLQYILGRWEFYGREYIVSEGVLIPRPETEMLVDFALDYLKGRSSPVVIDLCAGTGCIGLTVAALMPEAGVLLAEKYDEAFAVLRENARGISNAEIFKGDIFDDSFISSLPECDLLLSNPPYIRTDALPSLQREVQREPVTALDGGEDGLEFYRALSGIYRRICKGAAAFECGEDQSEELLAMFPGSYIVKDFSGNDRMIVIKGENR